MKIRTPYKRALLMALVCFWQLPSLLAQNLLSNGSFEAGNSGFASDYTYSLGDLNPAGVYDVVRDPHDSHPGGASFTDHTSGTGFMLAVNGGPDITQVVWSESVTVGLGVMYEFSGWGASWGDDGTGHDPAPAAFHIRINGAVIGPSFQLSAVDGQWQSFSLPWTSTASGSALIELRLDGAEPFGNDPAFDDFRFVAVPEPSTWSLLSGATAVGWLWRWRHRRKHDRAAS